MPRDATVIMATLPVKGRVMGTWISVATAVLIAFSVSSVHGLKNCGDALSAANAHGDRSILPTDPAQFVKCLDGHNRPSGSQRMPEGNPAAIGVCLLRREAEFATDCKWHV
jgi:hypothetical protein